MDVDTEEEDVGHMKDATEEEEQRHRMACMKLIRQLRQSRAKLRRAKAKNRRVEAIGNHLIKTLKTVGDQSWKEETFKKRKQLLGIRKCQIQLKCLFERPDDDASLAKPSETDGMTTTIELACQFEGCDKTFAKEKDYIIHYNGHFKRFRCKWCTKRYESRKLFIIHVEWAHGKAQATAAKKMRFRRTRLEADLKPNQDQFEQDQLEPNPLPEDQIEQDESENDEKLDEEPDNLELKKPELAHELRERKCPICQEQFTRVDHIQSHYARRSGRIKKRPQLMPSALAFDDEEADEIFDFLLDRR